MRLLYESRIKEDFEGWDGDKVFELDNGTKWQQKYYKYHYHYRYRPVAKIFQDGSNYFLEIECMSEIVEVVKID